MPELTRRRDPEFRHESWRVLHSDVDVGTIAMRSGIPDVEVAHRKCEVCRYPERPPARRAEAIQWLIFPSFR
jgi:hypothetical protein